MLMLGLVPSGLYVGLCLFFKLLLVLDDMRQMLDGCGVKLILRFLDGLCGLVKAIL